MTLMAHCDEQQYKYIVCNKLNKEEIVHNSSEYRSKTNIFIYMKKGDNGAGIKKNPEFHL